MLEYGLKKLAESKFNEWKPFVVGKSDEQSIFTASYDGSNRHSLEKIVNIP